MREKIIHILQDFNEDVDYENEQRLIDGGYLDSMDLTAIIVELELAFGVAVDAAKIVPENFNSVGAILEMLQSCAAKK